MGTRYKCLGPPKQFKDYLKNNGVFCSKEYIGCSRSDGVIKQSLQMYEKVKITENLEVGLYKYSLGGDKECHEEIQLVKDYKIFIKLKLQDGSYMEWTRDDINKKLKE